MCVCGAAIDIKFANSTKAQVVGGGCLYVPSSFTDEFLESVDNIIVSLETCFIGNNVVCVAKNRLKLAATADNLLTTTTTWK